MRIVITLRGRTVCGGIAIGKAMLYRREDSMIKRYHIDSIEAEIERFEQARKFSAYISKCLMTLIILSL